MFRKFVFVAFGLCFLIGNPFQSEGREPKIIRQSHSLFENKNCESTRSCSLKLVEYLAQDYKIRVGESYNFSTRLFARYQTDSLSTLEDYVFVQFIKGCIYTTERRNGALVDSYDITRYHFEEVKLFNHSEWVIDSLDKDPAY